MNSVSHTFNDILHKLKVLACLAERFNKAGINWAVGASALPYLKGKTDSFHDIDCMIVDRDAEKVKKILTKTATFRPTGSKEHYKSACFLQFVIDGVEVEIMGSFLVNYRGKGCLCPLEKDPAVEQVSLFGQKIPLQSLQTWHEYYTVMGRKEKAALCNARQ